MSHLLDQVSRDYLAVMKERNICREAITELVDALRIIAESEEYHGDSFVCDFYTLQTVARSAIDKVTGEPT